MKRHLHLSLWVILVVVTALFDLHMTVCADNSDWKTLYTEIIDNDTENSTFALVCIDDDNIPELIVNSSVSAVKKLVWLKDGKSETQAINNGALLYYEKQGLFYGDYAHGGIFYEKVYKLENHLLSTVAERAVKGDETNPDYFVNEKTATKEEYDASLQNVFDMDNAKTLDSYHSKEDILKTINDYESVDDTTKKSLI